MPAILHSLKQVQKASRELAHLSEKKINQVLKDMSEAILKEQKTILKQNQIDLANMDPKNPAYDRLLLNKERLKGISNDLRNVAKLPFPINRVIEKRTLLNGLRLRRVTVPLGVIGIIYEARPNVTFDVFSLCFKSGNACVLKGGSDANHSNVAIFNLIQKVLKKDKINPHIVYLMPPDREALKDMFTAHGLIDVIIPRGGQGLINFVRENSEIPVIETGAGIVHTYIDEDADIFMAQKIIFNAKTRRPSVCNALDTLIISKNQLKNLPKLVSPLEKAGVELFADDASYKKLHHTYTSKLLQKARKEDFGKEFLSLKMSIKTVDNLDQALDHIAHYSSKHSEAIISNNKKNIERFLKEVDAAALYANTSTAFTDGAQFGLGAEIGISTQKLHARGPMALDELTSYKWIVEGNGQIRKG